MHTTLARVGWVSLVGKDHGSYPLGVLYVVRMPTHSSQLSSRCGSLQGMVECMLVEVATSLQPF